MTGDTLYRRIVSPGGRVTYEPVAVEDSRLAWGPGSYLVVVRPGMASTTRIIEPDNAALLAASVPARDAMVRAMQSKDKPTPEAEDTERQRRAWQAYVDAGGTVPLVMRRESAAAVVDAGIAALVDVAQRPTEPEHDP